MREKNGMKMCPKCGKTLPVSEFHKSLRAVDGLQLYCKDCLRAAIRSNYARNRERNLKRLAGEDV